MDPGQMISWRRYGYRMIGSAQSSEQRAALARARYMGASLNFTAANFASSGAALVGEGTVAKPPPKVISFHLGPPAPKPPAKVISFHLSPPPPSYVPPAIVATSPDRAPAPYDVPGTPAACPMCPTVPLGAAAAGVASGAILMYVVGLMTREKNKRRRR